MRMTRSAARVIDKENTATEQSDSSKGKETDGGSTELQAAVEKSKEVVVSAPSNTTLPFQKKASGKNAKKGGKK